MSSRLFEDKETRLCRSPKRVMGMWQNILHQELDRIFKDGKE